MSFPPFSRGCRGRLYGKIIRVTLITLFNIVVIKPAVPSIICRENIITTKVFVGVDDLSRSGAFSLPYWGVIF
jgi:hypothetical protein